ncbi:glucuronate isomerase [Rhizobiales bacterium GAS113]|nr:glucuronate isomerase [Rhizobiales bacterium GAS113]
MSSHPSAARSGAHARPARTEHGLLHPDRLFPAEPALRAIARRLYASVEHLPILSPHGHTDPRWYAENKPFPDPATLFVKPDHYVTRMLYSQGVTLEELGIARQDGGKVEGDARKVWQVFAANYHLFRGTPTRAWLDHAFATLFDLEERLSARNADAYFDRIAERLATPQFLPRTLFERFRIEAIATTESPLDELRWHAMIRDSGWGGRVITAYRPDSVVDPEFDGFADNLVRFGEIAGEDIGSFEGYLAAHRKRRRFFKSMGATSTDHGHPTAKTQDLSPAEARRLYAKVRTGLATPAEAETFRAQMLTEMAAMSLEDGLVMQLHPGSLRNHNPTLHARFGRDIGADIPTQTEYVRALKPLLDRFGNERSFTLILFTLDETAYGRELAPLAGHYPCLRLGPPWWFFDSYEGMKRFREIATETVGFYNTVGFNDDTRAFCSIPARHDVARRVDCAYLAELVASHRLDEDEAHEIAQDLAYRLPKAAYKL